MTTMLRPVPEALSEAATLWKQAGCPDQHPSPWSPIAWGKWFPEHADFLAELPQSVSRTDATATCAEAPNGPEQATRAFVAAMIWGYGRVGYGPFRTKRVLTENERAGQTLADVAKLARDEGGPAAFEWLAQPQHRLRWLGVAFATKYLFFCAANGSRTPAPVLDRLVRGWLWRNAGWSLSLDWNVTDYHAYVDAVCAWGAELGVTSGNVEMLMFQLAANADPTSAWRAPQLFASSLAETAEAEAFGMPEEAQALLGVLDEAADAFAALPGSTAAEDIDDFEHGVRQLKRIVLARR